MLNTADSEKKYLIKIRPINLGEEIKKGYFLAVDISEVLEKFDEKNIRLRKLIDAAGIGVVILNQDHMVIDLNQRFADMLGYDLEGMQDTFRTRHRRKDGSIYYVEISAYGISLEGEEGIYNASICICQDISERIEIERKLKTSESNFRNLVENSSEIIFTLKEDGKIFYVSPNCKHITGFRPEDLQGKKMSDFFISEELALAERVFRKRSFSGKASEEDFKFKHNDGSIHWYNVNCSSSLDVEGNKILICHAKNIDERKEYEKELHYLSTHDQLTGIYNRSFFEAFLEHQSKRREYPLTLLVCDIDNLKVINDTFGYFVGDRVIKRCASAIKENLRKGDFLARTGGDEFAVILPSTTIDEANLMIDRISRSIKNVNKIEKDWPCCLFLSTGAATAESAEYSIEKVLSDADNEMYQQKANKEAI